MNVILEFIFKMLVAILAIDGLVAFLNYLPNLIQLLDDDGVIFADNVLLHGMVESNERIPHKKRTMVVNLRKYLDIVSREPFETELLRLEDGIAITKYKGDKIC